MGRRIASRKRVTRSAVVEAVVESFLSPDHADMQEAALTRRLDRLSRQVARLERDQRITTETLALFVRFWLTGTPPIPPEDQASAQAKGRERFEGFLETLGKRVQQGRSFADEMVDDDNGRNTKS
ncbi:CopG family transcriptional regulator [Natronohydrobacter thiooxidans]|uniref:CopG family transcriptional regulator n=1 Tax=Natronohydrobacter thiooxidans TaxID=87172 RepID=UPI0008FF6FE8|nr:CopG family transcriptional regulator [Natronohydrobacter thiooxidans]